MAAFLGIAGRLDWLESPEWLQRPWVIALAVALAVVELIVDKIPAVDSVWDAIHTGIRPAAGAVLLSGADVDAGTVGLAVGRRAARPLVPQRQGVRAPAREHVAGTGEQRGGQHRRGRTRRGADDLAIANPELAVALTVVLFVASIVVTIVAFKTVRRAMASPQPAAGACLSARGWGPPGSAQG